METGKPNRGLLAALALGALLFFGAGMGRYDLWPADEPRYAEIAREMLDTGDWLVLRVNGQPYVEKPPLFFWSIAAVSFPFGEVSAYTARVPSLLAGAATVLLTYLLALRMSGSRVALWSALVLMTNYRFWWQARTAQIDMTLALFMTLALLAFWEWHQRREKKWLVVLYASTAMGLFAKGPPALLFPLMMGIAFYWNGWRRSPERRQLHLVWGLLLACLPVALWWIPARLGAQAQTGAEAQAAVATDLFRNIVGRAFLGVSHANPPWYYLETFATDWLPWTFLAPWTLLWVWRRRKGGDETLRFLLCWTVPAFIVFSIMIGKRAVYLLPLFPVFSILIARSLIDLAESDRLRWRQWTVRAWGGLLVLGGAVSATAFVLAYRFPETWMSLAKGGQAALLLDPAYQRIWVDGFALLSGSALGVGAALLLLSFRDALRTLGLVMAFPFAGLSLIAALTTFPAMNQVLSARYICAPIRQLAEAGADFDLYSVGFSREEYVLHARRFHEPRFVELVPMESALEPVEIAKRQRKLQRAINQAVEDVSIASFDAMTDTEIGALRAAIEAAMAEEEVEPEFVHAFEAALLRDMAAFDREFGGERPAYFFVEHEDLRWIVALTPHLGQYKILDHRQVGSREILLVANEQGAALVTPRG